ncbi:UDP-glucose--hexose-1-phosphate uridylyltransferase [Pseudalkalibacillus hwajinpoensis]|uniref:Galactose-1-phosphate uridylyltransferase n=1 Tax=Guptibacillus hwajinpoensis TaxID=208199 RepID=A0A4U1MJZ6_9BACL|nr:UDP-glucose--hexose-1-phosphate uridylyltransferase [Pseudalkalibacillus hwajinpoensis]TKD70914.1 UDP-glucose--hexose-1-phosphate uridylyltransferase [Pseudalkalibacillus hwajinpoensis]
MTINHEIERLLYYAIKREIIREWDMSYARNQILDVLQLTEYHPENAVIDNPESPVEILENILDWAYENGRLAENTVTYRDLLDTKIMGCLTERPSSVVDRFETTYREVGPEAATASFYQFSKDVHYIRTDRIAKNEHWLTATEYGDMEITINLSKPEKDPKAIAAAKNMKTSSYPECLLCKENVGYAGRLTHPARQNLRLIPVTLEDKQWYLQYSPYVYYNEHAIVLYGEHEPMKISRGTFDRLLEFVNKFPHYFIGSNADLPIVGGSILSHDHFQGGKHDFPMAKAGMERTVHLSSYPNVKAGIVKWPMSVLRLQSDSRDELGELADAILKFWQEYSDEQVDVHAYTAEEPHNTITPIARRNGEQFEIDLVLRNNRTTDEHPMGLFHPHAEVHHIKKENIGLIEVMGLAVLPGRLKEELQLLGNSLIAEEPLNRISADDRIAKHVDWAKSILEKYPDIASVNIDEILKDEVGLIFSDILSHAGVFKQDDAGQAAFDRFTEALNNYLNQ